MFCFFFFFNDTATTEIYTLSLHDALPISAQPLAKRPEFSFRLAAGGSLPPLSQCPLDGGRKTHEIRLHHVVGGAALHPTPGKFLADRSRNEDKKRVRANLTCQGERGHAVGA